VICNIKDCSYNVRIHQLWLGEGKASELGIRYWRITI
jgi:hypothetical protein